MPVVPNETFRIDRDGSIASPAPAPTPAPTPAPPVPVPPPAPAPVVIERRAAPTPVGRADVPARTPSQRSRARATIADVPAEPVAEPDVVVAPPLQAPPDVLPVPVTPGVPSPSANASPAAPEAQGGAWWPWAVPLLAGLAGLAFLLRRRRGTAHAAGPMQLHAEPDVAADVPEPEPATPLAAAPIAVPVRSTPPPVAQPIAEPRLDLTFTPAAASTGEARASVEFALTVANEGDAPARRVRMEARLFAMGNDHEDALAAFFAAPLERPIPIASAVAPGVHAALRSQVALPLTGVRPIAVNDRQLFVPLVAFKVLYEYAGPDGDIRTSQTTSSYVVGRENKPPASKMAPFRLDQGPRQYREVGHRVHRA